MNRLETTQRWLTSIIIRPGKLRDKISAADKTYALDHEKLIRASQLSSETRISIYARGYVLRLMECMRADYPLLAAFLGEELFTAFAQAYLVRLPPTSPSLFDLGADFPGFLKASQPPHEDAQEDRSMFDLPVELAQVERIRVEVARSKGLEGFKNLSEDTSFFYFLGAASFKISPCLRLLELNYELLDFIKTLESGEHGATPAMRKNYLAISRKNYSVNMQELEGWQWQYLQALSAEHAHADAIKIAAANSHLTEETIMADLLLWLPVAANCGYVYEEQLSG